jgi:hypothetical protein
MVMGRALIVVITWILLARSAEAARCAGDVWGGRASFITAQPNNTVSIVAQTNLLHLGGSNLHQAPPCSGSFYARAEVLAPGGQSPNCFTPTGVSP